MNYKVIEELGNDLFKIIPALTNGKIIKIVRKEYQYDVMIWYHYIKMDGVWLLRSLDGEQWSALGKDSFISTDFSNYSFSIIEVDNAVKTTV